MEINRWYQDDCTPGRGVIEGFHFLTLELPWLHNQKNISCITPGTYEYFLRNSPQNGMVLELRNVEDRSQIQMHSGNYTRQILGCILVGDGLKYLDNDSILDVTNSVKTKNKILSLAGRQGHLIIN